MSMLSDKLIIESIKKQYILQINEVKAQLDVGLTVKSKVDDKHDRFVKGTKFVINAVGNEGVVLKQYTNNNDIKPDNYRSELLHISYEDLSRHFEI